MSKVPSTAARTLLLASANDKKREELARGLAGLDYELKSLADFPDIEVAPEEETTFSANARQKALFYSRRTGLLCVADDSGLVVDALGGEPGVRSARYAGERATDVDNRIKLRNALAAVPREERGARFCCAIALARGSEILFECEGTTEGFILEQEQGSAGFGYDPLFESTDLGRSFGVAEAEAKDRVSHRGRALMLLIQFLREKTP